MTNDEKLEMIMAAERLLGKSPQESNIFTNPSHCLDAVNILGEFHLINIYPVYIGVELKHIGWSCYDVQNDNCYEIAYPTYEEAVGAACVEVMK